MSGHGLPRSIPDVYERLEDLESGSGSVTWDDVTDKPATFPPVIGTTAQTAKAGNYQPTWGQVTGKPNFSDVATSGAYGDLTGTPQGVAVADATDDAIATVNALLASLRTAGLIAT